MTRAMMIQGMPPALTCGPNTVAITASAMPIMPNRLPRRAVSGWARPPRLRMKRMVAPIYETVAMLEVIVFSLLAEHRQHATRDREAAEHIDGRQREREEGQEQDQPVGSVGHPLGQRRRHL